MYLGKGDRTRSLTKRMYFLTSVEMESKDRRIEHIWGKYQIRVKTSKIGIKGIHREDFKNILKR